MIHGGNVWQGNSPAQWLDYSANIRPEGAPNWVKAALMRAMDRLSYYPDPTMQKAKQALSNYLELPAEYVLPTAGGISAIDMATHLPGTRILQFTPCFARSCRHLKIAGWTSLPSSADPIILIPCSIRRSSVRPAPILICTLRAKNLPGDFF